MINLWFWLHFFSDHGYFPHFVDIIRISWISTFRGYNFHSMDVIRISWILWIYPRLVDIVCIVCINIYLYCNFCLIFHIYSSIVSEWCITYFPVCNLTWVSFICTFYLFALWVSINWNLTLYGYMCLLLSLPSNLVFIFHLIFRFPCCTGVLYKRVLWISCFMRDVWTCYDRHFVAPW